MAKFEQPEKILGVDFAFVKMFIVPLVLSLLIWGLTSKVLLPQVGQISANFKKAKELEVQKKLVKDKIDYLSSVSEAELNKNSNLLKAALLTDKDSYYLVNVIRKVADKVGFMVDGFNINVGKINETDNSVKKIEGVEQLPVTLSLIGPGDQYLNLLIGLENSLPILSIRKFDMKGGVGASTLNLVISAFYLKTEDTLKVGNLSLGDLKLSEDEKRIFGVLNKYDDNHGDVARIKINNEGTPSADIKYGRENPFTL